MGAERRRGTTCSFRSGYQSVALLSRRGRGLMVQRTWIQVPHDWPSGSAVGQEPDRVLHHARAERQDIIFSHDSQVLAWALSPAIRCEHLDGARRRWW